MARRLALIIGNSAYRDDTLARLLTPDIDVGALAEILLDPDVGAFDDAKVLVNMTSATIRRAISNFFNQKSREDLLLLYFSGHGVLDDRGRLHLAVKDTDHNLLRGTAVSASFITDEMDNSRSQRQVIILDCCHSGAFARGTKGAPGLSVGTAAAFEGTGFGRVVLTATDATQYAWEGNRILGEAENSLFTHYLVQGLQSGEADINGDGRVTIDELYDFVYGQVVRQTPKQTPGKWSFKEQGEIVIARAGRLQAIFPSTESKPAVDPELSRELDGLYTKGLSAFWLEEWERAAHYFQTILSKDPDYTDVSEKFAEVQRQLKLKLLYDAAKKALDGKKYSDAVASLEALIGEAPDYKDAGVLLKSSREKSEIAGLYAQAKTLHQAAEWKAVLQIFERIAKLDPDYEDPQGLLQHAKQAFERQEQQANLNGLYQQGLKAMNAGDWGIARGHFEQVVQQEPDYEDAQRLLQRVETEIDRLEQEQRRKAQLESLYEAAEQLLQARLWQQALGKLQEIKALDPEFSDPKGIGQQAEEALARDDEQAQREGELSALYAEAVNLLNGGQYQGALEKWKQVAAEDPHFVDRENVQSTARKKLRATTKTRKFKIGSYRNVILAFGAIAVIVAIILLLPGQKCPAGALYCEDFESGAAEGWELNPAWQVVRERENNVLVGKGDGWTRLIGDSWGWKNYRAHFRFNAVAGKGSESAFLFRVSPYSDEDPLDPDPGRNNYIVYFMFEGVMELAKKDGGTIGIAPGYDPGAWQDADILVQGGLIQVSINNRRVFEHIDPEPIPNGTIAFLARGDSKILVDEIVVMPAGP